MNVKKLVVMFKVYYRNILVLLFLSMASALFSQNVGINTTGATPSTNAILDLNTGNSSRNLGIVIPNVSITALTTFNPPMANTYTATATKNDSGLMVYNTNAAIGSGVGYYYWLPSSASAGTWTAFAGSSVNACGTAAAGYAPYFTSSSAICNSVIYQGSTTTVGIGTTAPQNMLDVNGGMAVGSYAGTNAAPTNGVIVSGQVGIGNSAPNAAAALDLSNTSYLGMLAPRMTASQISAMTYPVAVGLMVYNTNTGCFEFNSTGTSTGWNSIGCPCSAAPGAAGSITVSPASPTCSTASQTFTIAAVTGASSYTWTYPSFAGTVTGQGTATLTVSSYTAAGTGTVTVTPNNTCGSGTASTTAITVWSGSPSGSLSYSTSTSTYCTSTVSLTGATDYSTITWAISPSTAPLTTNANLTAAQNTTSLTLSGGTGGTGKVTATLTNPCGSTTYSTTTITTYTTGLSQDGSIAEMASTTGAPTTMTITTTGAPDIILIAVEGCCDTYGSTVTVDGNPVSSIQQTWYTYNTGTGVTTSNDEVLAYVAPTAGTHTVAVANYVMTENPICYAIAIKGFYCIPTVAGNITTADNYLSTTSNLSQAIVPAATNSYLFGAADWVTTGSGGTTTWTNLTSLNSYSISSSGSNWDFLFAGNSVTSTSSVTVTTHDSHDGGTYDVLILVDVHP